MSSLVSNDTNRRLSRWSRAEFGIPVFFQALALAIGLTTFSADFARASPAASTPSPEATLDPLAIMTKNEKARSLADVTSDAILTNIDSSGGKKEKKFSWWRKLGADQVHFKTLTRFHSPAEIRDEAILFLEKENGQAEVLLYLPAFKKNRRVENQAQSGSFMASEFSYADIATPHLNDFSYKAMPMALCPDSGECHVIEATPKSEDVRDRLGYARQVYWVRTDNFMISRGEFYGLDNILLKRFDAREIKQVDVANNRWMSNSLAIENLKNRKRTTIEFTNVKVNQGIPDGKFMPQNMSRL